MVVTEKEDLGLSLSLGNAVENHSYNRFNLPLQLNLMPAASVAPSMPFAAQQKAAAAAHWSDLPTSSSAERASLVETARPFLKGIDVNRAPAAEREMEEEAGASSPNSTVSSVSGKRGHREESENDRACSGGGGPTSDDEDGGEASRKKLRLSKDQSAVLEESFKEHNTLNPKQKLALAKQLNLRPRQVEVWFQNRRARTKLKQTEVDCEFLKRCCENLTEENRRLQKEVQELRALKLSPQFYMHMTPPTTLTMCPSCERVAVSSSSNSAAPTTPSTPAPPPVDAQHHRTSNTNGANNNNGIGHSYPQQQQQQQLQHHPFFQAHQQQHRPALPWSPAPLRTAAFLDAPPQRS